MLNISPIPTTDLSKYILIYNTTVSNLILCVHTVYSPIIVSPTALRTSFPREAAQLVAASFLTSLQSLLSRIHTEMPLVKDKVGLNMSKSISSVTVGFLSAAAVVVQ